MSRKREAFEKARTVSEDDLRPMPAGISPYPSPVKRGDSFFSRSPELILEGEWVGWRMRVPDEDGGGSTWKTFWEQRVVPEAGSWPAKTSSIVDGRKGEHGLPASVTARNHLDRSKEAARARLLFKT